MQQDAPVVAQKSLMPTVIGTAICADLLQNT